MDFNIKRMIRFYDRLSTRLITLTALWVTFIICAIGYQMYLSQQVQTAGAYQYEVGSLPARVYRLNLFADRAFGGEDFATQYRAIDEAMRRIGKRDLGDEFFIDRSKEQKAVDALLNEWRNVVGPLFLLAREKSNPIGTDELERFITKIDTVNKQIAVNRDKALMIQRGVQTLLMFLAIGSLFGIMYFLMSWVIRPTEYVRTGLSAVREGKLDTRLHLVGASEFEAIAADFNAMAGRLQDLVENLAAKVKEKTEAVEEKNRNLSHLYEMTSFVSQQHSVDEMCEGFAARLMQYTPAQACAVFLIDRKRGLIELSASMDVPAKTFAWFSMNPLPLEGVEESLRSDLPLRITPGMPEDFLSQLRVETEKQFRTAYLFHIRSGSKDLGFFLLYFNLDTRLLPQTYKLYESFGSHLGIAVDSLRLVEREQQYAVVQERNLMAQGLHDSIAQSLSFLNLQVQLLESGLHTDDKELVDTTVAQIKAGVQESYEDVRELLLNFRERVHKEKFIDGVRTVINRFEAQANVEASLRVVERGPELTDRQKVQVIFIIQEALSNVRKHARASHVNVVVENYDDLRVVVEDDGVGIDEKLVESRKGRHVGLSIMSERASRIGAEVTVERASEEGGTRVVLFLAAKDR